MKQNVKLHAINVKKIQKMSFFFIIRRNEQKQADFIDKTSEK